MGSTRVLPQSARYAADPGFSDQSRWAGVSRIMARRLRLRHGSPSHVGPWCRFGGLVTPLAARGDWPPHGDPVAATAAFYISLVTHCFEMKAIGGFYI